MADWRETVPPWTKYFLELLGNEVDLKGKRVLEIGGHNVPPEWIFGEQNISKYVAVDYTDFWGDSLGITTMSEWFSAKLSDAEKYFHRHKYLKFSGDASKIPECFYNEFDVVISFCAFEHIKPLPQVLDKSYNSLRGGGILWSKFAPIFSGSCGHHYYLDGNYNFNYVYRDHIPEFAHLIWNEEEMREYFASHPLPRPELVEVLIDYSYHNDMITRRLWPEYEELMAKSRFDEWFMEPYNIGSFDTGKPDEKTLAILKRKYPQVKCFSNGALIYAVKQDRSKFINALSRLKR